jgi:hypothetical protein
LQPASISCGQAGLPRCKYPLHAQVPMWQMFSGPYASQYVRYIRNPV